MPAVLERLRAGAEARLDNTHIDWLTVSTAIGAEGRECQLIAKLVFFIGGSQRAPWNAQRSVREIVVELFAVQPTPKLPRLPVVASDRIADPRRYATSRLVGEQAGTGA